MSLAALILLFVFTASWYLLALLPALREAVQKTDARALTVEADYSGDATHFAHTLLELISANFPGRRLRARGDRLEGLLDNGDPYTLIPYREQAVTVERHELISHSVERVLLSYAPLRVPARAAALASIYAARELDGEMGSVYRAVFCESDVALDDYCVVLRWVHAEGYLVLGRSCSLFGRASSARGIRLMPGCRFERLAAPRIEFGEPGHVAEPVAALLEPAHVRHLPDLRERRQVVPGDVMLPARSFVGHDIVATGLLRIGTGCWIAGSLKAHGDVMIEGSSRIDGSVVGGHDVFVGGHCLLRGPVIAERNVVIEGPAQVGTAARPTTVTAPHIYFSSGVLVFGSVWARSEGALEPSGAESQPAPLASVA